MRRLRRSRVSSALGRKIKIGHRVKLKGPFGAAYLRRNHVGRLVLFRAAPDLHRSGLSPRRQSGRCQKRTPCRSWGSRRGFALHDSGVVQAGSISGSCHYPDGRKGTEYHEGGSDRQTHRFPSVFLAQRLSLCSGLAHACPKRYGEGESEWCNMLRESFPTRSRERKRSNLIVPNLGLADAIKTANVKTTRARSTRTGCRSHIGNRLQFLLARGGPERPMSNVEDGGGVGRSA